MNKAAILATHERVVEFLRTEPAERQVEFTNILVDCWDLTQEGMGYIVGRLVESAKIATRTGQENDG